MDMNDYWQGSFENKDTFTVEESKEAVLGSLVRLDL
jgi:hypothetical protein